MALTINLAVDLKAMKNTLASRRCGQLPGNIRLKSKKCLFGASNEEETYQMVKENFDGERERFYERFGVHMEDIDKMTIDEEEYRRMKYRPVVMSPPQASGAGAGGGGKVLSKKTIRMKRVLKPYNANNQQAASQNQQQMRITDFCQVKKAPTSSNLPLEPNTKNVHLAKKLQVASHNV